MLADGTNIVLGQVLTLIDMVTNGATPAALVGRLCGACLDDRLIETLGVDFKYHYLRHTYGTRLAEQNTPMHLLCNQMGHANSKVTERYYLAVSKQGTEIIKNKLEEI